MSLQFSQLAPARAYANLHQLREKAVCYVTWGAKLLVFDHVPDDSGVQVAAGGVEIGETPAQAASREVAEETGQLGFGAPSYLGSAVWINLEHAKREMRHFFHLTAPPELPETWDCLADEHLFRFRWAALNNPQLDWDFDTFLSKLKSPVHTGATP
ncbi:NUDIX hydrolase [Deinococcus sp.]|uniref:NUDIX hydrolase n=1 Tax=Deinococcus sp. TaxID=47478 RepID=UPI003B594439